MPLFDYQCEKCNLKFAELRKGSEKDLPVNCPSCHAPTSKRLVTGFAVGAGGYSTGASAATACSSAGGFG